MTGIFLTKGNSSLIDITIVALCATPKIAGPAGRFYIVTLAGSSLILAVLSGMLVHLYQLMIVRYPAHFR